MSVGFPVQSCVEYRTLKIYEIPRDEKILVVYIRFGGIIDVHGAFRLGRRWIAKIGDIGYMINLIRRIRAISDWQWIGPHSSSSPYGISLREEEAIFCGFHKEVGKKTKSNQNKDLHLEQVCLLGDFALRNFHCREGVRSEGEERHQIPL
jgi:hypothetical protein